MTRKNWIIIGIFVFSGFVSYKINAVRIAKEGCKQLFAQNFSHRVENVRLCNLNLMGNDIYLIHYEVDGNTNLRQCLVGDGYVQIPSAFSPLQC